MATCAPPSDFQVLRARTEFLGTHLHKRASWKSIWLNIVPREEWPRGAGYVMSSFEIGRQYPDSPELNWATILPANASTNPSGACNVPWNQVNAGELEKTHKPSVIGMVGPTVCQDDFTHKWESPAFWSDYYDQMQRHATMIPINRLGTVYMHYSYKMGCMQNAVWVPGKWAASQPPPAFTDMSDFLVGGAAGGPPTSYLTQQFLDQAHLQLINEGAGEGDVASWINMIDSGFVWPLYIGQEASQAVFLNNPDRRADINAGFMGLKEMDPTLMRLGATKIVGNFRHVMDAFPRRYAYVPYGTSINLTSTGTNGSTNALWQTQVFANIDGTTTNPYFTNNSTPVYGLNTVWSNPSHTDSIILIPDHVRSTSSTDVTQGVVSVTNGCWNDPTVYPAPGNGGPTAGLMQIETCVILNPLVMTEHVVLPTNSMPGMNLTPQNYMGQWKFVDGPDAFNGIGGCTVVADPLHKLGRHFGEYRSSWEPVHPVFGRVIAFKRCAGQFTVVGCS